MPILRRNKKEISRKSLSMERSELVELIGAALRAADGAKAKGVFTTSPEASRCAEILNRIKSQPLTAEVICSSNTTNSLQCLTRHGNPVIRSTARSVFDIWRRTLYVSWRDGRDKFDRKDSCLTGKVDSNMSLPKKSSPGSLFSAEDSPDSAQILKSSSLNGNKPSRDEEDRERSRTEKKIVIDTQLLELFEAAKKAADAVKESASTWSPEAKRCVDALDQIKRVPQSLTRDVIFSTNTGTRLESLTKHRNPRICSAAKSLLDFWREILYASGRPNCTDKKTESNNADKKSSCMKVEACKVDSVKYLHKKPTSEFSTSISTESSTKLRSSSLKTDDSSSRSKVREILGEALAKVAGEAYGSIKQQVLACNPWKISVSLESVMFEKLGPYNGPKRSRYSSILLNMSDRNNPDLRRKVLLGEIKAEKLISMKSEELRCEKKPLQVQQINSRAIKSDERSLKQVKETSAFKGYVHFGSKW